MSAALLNQGKTVFRDALKTAVTHIGISTDSTAFSATQTALNPSGAGTNLIKASTETNTGSNNDQFDATISVNGDSEFTGSTINTIGLMSGSTASAVISRTVRSSGIGVQAGDNFSIGIRVVVQDNS